MCLDTLATLAPAWLRQLAWLPLRLRSVPGAQIVDYCLHDDDACRAPLRVALPITFTPYAATGPCTARCRFCSENLRMEGAGRHAAQLRPGPDYFSGLQCALQQLAGLPMGISLSGLEPTADPHWLRQLLATLQQGETHAEQPYTEKILYSNGTGFAEDHSREALLSALCDFGLRRVEWSRHSHVQEHNDRIMRFRPDSAIAGQPCFTRSLALVQAALPVTLVCILQQGGIASLAGVQAYLQWAVDMGVHRVVFRELAQLDGQYRANNTSLYVQRSRVGAERMVRALLEQQHPSAADFSPLHMTEGYYFWNVEFLWRGQLTVVFEASDYPRMHECHDSEVVYKLVYHANGCLTAGWDPQRRVLFMSEKE